MEKALFCQACGAQLTRPLLLRSGKDPSVSKPVHADRQPLTPAGEAYKSYEPIMRSFGDEPATLEFTPQHWLNPADLTEAVGATGTTDRLSGCCGVAGIDGPNQVCRCGAEIGTLQDDCWTAKVFIPEPAATEWRDN